MLRLRRIDVAFKTKRILFGLSLSLMPGELSVLVGRNGAGKSSLANALIANRQYVVKGEASFRSVEMASLTELEAARLGCFMAFQHPVEIPGVLCVHFVKLAASRAGRGLVSCLPSKLSVLVALLGLSSKLLYRPVNVGFSGGEKRALELIQMVALEPNMCVLDEIDSGLDRLKLSQFVEVVLAFEASFRSILVISHSISFINALSPDSVYCLVNGRLLSLRRRLYFA
ncbi:ATP-binding cassette domain-containing protein [Candidatus Hodgkinia cicadicola]